MGFTSGVSGSSLPAGDDALIRRIQDLERQVRELGPSLMAGVGAAISSMVATDGGSTNATDWSLTSGAWVTVASFSITPPTWATGAVVNASSAIFLVSNAAYAVPSIRVLIGGVSSMAVELPQGTGASAIPFYGSQGFTRKIAPVSAPVLVEAQVYVLNTAYWLPGATNRMAQISATAIFTR